MTTKTRKNRVSAHTSGIVLILVLFLTVITCRHYGGPGDAAESETRWTTNNELTSLLAWSCLLTLAAELKLNNASSVYIVVRPVMRDVVCVFFLLANTARVFSALDCTSFEHTVSDKFTESMYVLANEPSVALYRLQEHVRRSLPELVQHKVSVLWHARRKGLNHEYYLFTVSHHLYLFITPLPKNEITTTNPDPNFLPSRIL